MKKIGMITFLLMFPIVLAANISPDTWSVTLEPGAYTSKNFNLTFVNESCTRIINGTASSWIIGLPESVNATGVLQLTNFPIGIQVPDNVPSGTYYANIYYCDQKLLDIDISIPQTGQPGSQCNLIVTILGSKMRGKSMSFDVRDTNYNPKDATIYITRADGTTERIDCPGGFCSWLIPPTEEGPIIVRTVVAGCNPVTKQIDLAGELIRNETEGTEISGGKITITGPTEASLGEDFQFLIIGKSQPLQWVNIQIVGPGGYTFSGTTNSYGIVVDSSNKIFGTDIKPNKVGDYTLFANREGYAPAEFHFKLIKKECPYECCPEGEYVEKPCPEGYQCKDFKCSPIIKPRMKITCTPKNPIVLDTISCKIIDQDNKLISEDVEATIKYDGTQDTILFSSGIANFSISKPAKVTIEVPDLLDYKGTTYTMNVSAPPVPIIWIILIIAIIAITVLLIVLIRRRGKGSPEFKIELESKPETVEKVVTER